MCSVQLNSLSQKANWKNTRVPLCVHKKSSCTCAPKLCVHLTAKDSVHN